MITQDSQQRGAVALLTTIIFSLLLSIVITGTVTVMISELHQSNDSEQSIRAYNAAEAGVEDAITYIKANPGTATTGCNKNLGLDPSAPNLVGWSCQQISYSSNLSGTLATPDKSQQFDVSGTSGMKSASLEWDTLIGRTATQLDKQSPNIPSAANWLTAKLPAAVELTIVSYPNGGAVTADKLEIKNLLILPSRTIGDGTGAISDSPGGNPFYGICDPLATYHCKIALTKFLPNMNYVIRIRTRYTGTDFQMKFYKSSGAEIQVPDGTATIDVTGKAGDVYRRVIYKVPITKGVATGLDYVLYSDTDVCKDLTIINTVVQPGSICP